MEIRIGFPAFCASAKAYALNGWGLAADASESPTAVAITAVTIRIERRDSMMLLFGLRES